jgi:pimeloyl-ACP methyl ester carboxylesterase
MPHVTANGIDLAYEIQGDDQAPPVLMIMGLGGQLTMWPDKLISDLVAGGYRVITFDNRDIGLSHQHHGEKTPPILRQILLRRLGIKLKTPYEIADMARDTIALIDALALDRVHLVGISMGGMIAQHVSSMAPERVTSLTAIMTSTGNPKLPRPSGQIMKAMIRRGPQPTAREDIISQSVANFGVIGTPGEDQNTNGMRDRITRSYDRNFNPAGVMRQMSAIVAAGDFRKHTRSIKAPTLVLHGSADPLVSIEGGRDIAKLVRGARFEVMDGMGHDVPPRFLPIVTKHMLDHFAATKVNPTPVDA